MILLSFDVEEFDMPFEYNKTLSFEEQISISYTGTERILELIGRHQVRATFFCTANFALHAPGLIKKIISCGHEVASHGYYHSEFKVEHLSDSKIALEKITGQKIEGYRMARMMPVDEKEIYLAGYKYNSSINPTWIPGRYNNLNKPRKIFLYENIMQIPASVSPLLRLPLFWISFHNLPLWFYKFLCIRTYKADGYLNLYFHPWEFTDLSNREKLGLPGFVSKNSGSKMLLRMESLIAHFKNQQMLFSTISDFTKNYKSAVHN